MAVEPPGDRTCGTLEAGWLATSHPSRGDAPLSGTVCFDADDASFKDCFRQTEVLVCACSYDGGQSIKYSYKLPAPPRCYCDRPAVRLGDRFVCPLPDTRNYCTFGREDKLRIVPRFGIPAALAPKKP